MKRILGCLAAAAAALTPLPAAEAAPEERARASASLGWFSDEAIDFFGTMQFDLPVAGGGYLTAEGTTTIAQTASDFTFLVRDVDYRLEAGWRQPADPTDGPRWSVFAGQFGTAFVDVPGDGWVRYAGAGLESAGARDRRPGWQWRGRLAAVIEDDGLSADLLLDASLRRVPRGGAGFVGRLGFDLELDVIADGSSTAEEWRAGPRLVLGRREGTRAALLLRAIASNHPFGSGVDGVWLALEMDGGPGSPPWRPALGALDTGAFVAAGGGDAEAARFVVQISSPRLFERWLATIEVDANLLTGELADDLYYLYHVGVEREGRFRPGVYFYHRSNHVASGVAQVTSINVAEAGIQTNGWRPGAYRYAPPGLASLDLMLRAGYLLDSDFGEEERWHARGGVRYWLPPDLRVRPYLQVEFEEGDVSRRIYAAGLGGRAWRAQIEYRRDDQWFRAEEDAWLLSVGTGY